MTRHSSYFCAKSRSCEAVKKEGQGRSSCVNETVISFVEAHRLQGISISEVIASNLLRDLQEKELEDKLKHFKGDPIPTSYGASIKGGDSGIFVTVGWVEC